MTKQSNKFTEKKSKKSPLQKSKKKLNFKITKEQITYLLLFIIDVIIIIYAAKKNYANYVSIAGSQSTYIGSSTKNLIFGKNYITPVTTLFFFIYICMLNKFMFHKNNTKKFIISILILLLITNCTLFYIFTNKIY